MRNSIRQRRHPRRALTLSSPTHPRYFHGFRDVPPMPMPSHERVMLQQLLNLVSAPMPCGLRPVYSPN